MKGKGQGVQGLKKKPNDTILGSERNWSDRMEKLGSDPHKLNQMEVVIDYAEGRKERKIPFTLASAFRCVDAIVKEYYTE